MKKLNYATRSHQHEYMSKMQRLNEEAAKKNVRENAVGELLKSVPLEGTWNPQRRWGYRIFDWWNGYLGCAVEVDGKEHNWKYDRYRDEYNFRRSGIIVVRVKNESFRDDLNRKLTLLTSLGDWKTRRNWVQKLRLFKIDDFPTRSYSQEFAVIGERRFKAKYEKQGTFF